MAGGQGGMLDLELDPDLPSARRAMEVYPHAASAGLFGVERTLKYKQKQGREVAAIRSELLRLIGFVEGLATATPSLDLTASPHWTALGVAVRAATRKSELRRAEDPIDAVLCAYIARYAATRPDDVTVYGDTITGSIVTPALKPLS